jgi:uncharacterized membrane-anchored protein
MSMVDALRIRTAKVPEVVFTFWIIKIAATTLGETGGDTLSMGLHLGYALSSVIFLTGFIVFVAAQIRARRFHPGLYWAAIVATTLVGTTMADFADRSMGIGYFGGSTLLFGLVLLVLCAWRVASGSISVNNITSVKNEGFYWVTILASNTLGTALGDLTSDGLNFGFAGGVVIFALALAVIAALYYLTNASRAVLFWAAFILTRPLGATMGDLLTKPVAHGGFDLSRPASSALIAAFMIVMILLTPQRAGGHPGQQIESRA